MSVYAHIKRCLELADRDIVSAIADRRLAKALLDQLAKVSRPGDGAPKLLLVFAKMATQSTDWIDGALRIEMVGDADVTVVEVLCELGLGMHERVFPSFKMNVPLEEFARAVERVPHMIEPLVIQNKSGRRLVLTATSDEDMKVSAPPAVSIADDSLYEEQDEARLEAKPQVTLEPAPKRRMSSGKHRAAARTRSRPDMPAVSPPRVISPTTGKTLRPAAPRQRTPPPPLPSEPAPASTAGKMTPPPLPMPQAPESTRRAPESSRARMTPPPLPTEVPGSRNGPASVREIVPKPPALPRMEMKPMEGRAVVARVSLTKMAAPKPQATAVKPRASGRPPPRASGRPPPRASVKPPALKSVKPAARTSVKPAARTSVKPPARNSSPPKSTRARGGKVSEPPDEEGIDLGWEDPD